MAAVHFARRAADCRRCIWRTSSEPFAGRQKWVVKALSRASNDLKAVGKHLDYIGRKGKLALETNDDERKAPHVAFPLDSSSLSLLNRFSNPHGIVRKPLAPLDARGVILELVFDCWDILKWVSPILNVLIAKSRNLFRPISLKNFLKLTDCD
jgi:hypothetical protein